MSDCIPVMAKHIALGVLIEIGLTENIKMAEAIELKLNVVMAHIFPCALVKFQLLTKKRPKE